MLRLAVVCLAPFVLSAPAHAACTLPDGIGGDLVYNSDHYVLQYCNGTDWIGLGGTMGGGPGVTDGDKGDITVSGSGSSWMIDAASVTYNKIQNVAAGRLLGRYAATAGVMQEITLGAGLSLNTSTGELTATGSVSGTGGAGYVSIWDGTNSLTRSGTSAGQQLFWDTTNHRLGIGTATPAVSLHVQNAAATNYIFAESTAADSSAGFVMKNDARQWNMYVSGTNDSFVLSDATAAQGRLVILANGNVGIGTASPTMRLAVAGDIGFQTGNVAASIVKNAYYSGGWKSIAPGYARQIRMDDTFIIYGTATAATAADQAITPVSHMTIDASGNVGIGTTAPGSKLTVAGDVYTSGNASIANAAPTLYLLDADHRSAMIHNNSNTLYFLRGSGNGSTSWTAYNGYWPLSINLENNDATFGGNVYAFGYFHNSDARLKENIKTIDDGLGIVAKLRGVRYQWKHDHAPALGVIAQDVEKVIPSAVKTNSKGDKTVEYDQLIGPLIEAVKELKADNDALRFRIEHLESAGAAQ